MPTSDSAATSCVAAPLFLPTANPNRPPLPPPKLPIAIPNQTVPGTPIQPQADLPIAFAPPFGDHPPASRRHCPTPKMASHAALLIISNRQSAPAATPSTLDSDTDSTPPGVPQSSSDPTCRRPLQPPVVDHPPASRRHCPTPKMASHAALLIISNRQSAPAATPSTPDSDTDSTLPGVPQSSSDPTCRRPLQPRSLTTLLPPEDTVQPPRWHPTPHF